MRKAEKIGDVVWVSVQVLLSSLMYVLANEWLTSVCGTYVPVRGTLTRRTLVRETLVRQVSGCCGTRWCMWSSSQE